MLSQNLEFIRRVFCSVILTFVPKIRDLLNQRQVSFTISQDYSLYYLLIALFVIGLIPLQQMSQKLINEYGNSIFSAGRDSSAANSNHTLVLAPPPFDQVEGLLTRDD